MNLSRLFLANYLNGSHVVGRFDDEKQACLCKVASSVMDANCEVDDGEFLTACSVVDATLKAAWSKLEFRFGTPVHGTLVERWAAFNANGLREREGTSLSVDERAAIAFMQVTSSGLSTRLTRCAFVDCGKFFFDVSPNRSARTCSDRCRTRTCRRKRARGVTAR